MSLGIHVSAFFGLMYTPPISLTVPQPSPSEYQQAFAGKEDKIVWYKFKELPSITPPSTPKAHRQLRAEVKAKQAVVSSPKNAPKRDQVVISPVPDIELPPLDLPNLIAVKLPPKPFTTPPDVIKPAAAQIPVPDGPQEVTAQELGPVNLPTEKLPGKTFVPPPTREAPPKPEIKVAEIDAAPIRPLVASAIPTEKLPARAYVPPAARPAAAAARDSCCDRSGERSNDRSKCGGCTSGKTSFAAFRASSFSEERASGEAGDTATN